MYFYIIYYLIEYYIFKINNYLFLQDSNNRDCGQIHSHFLHLRGILGGVQKNPRFLRKFQICGLITLLLDIVCLARGVSGGVSLPFLAKIRHFHSHFRLTFCGQLWGIWGGTSKKGQKWPKMVKNGQKWSKMAKNGLFGGSLGKPPPPPLFAVQILLENPGFRQKGHFPGFLDWGGRRGGSILAKNGNFGGFWGWN